MLPPEAKGYFDSLLSASVADLRSELADKQKEFQRNESARGQGPSTGFAARLSAIYKESLSAQAQAIVEALKTMHRSFSSPLDEDVDAQLQNWGGQALSDVYQGLENVYQHYLRQFGIPLSQASGLDHTYALAQVTVANQPRTYLWELRNVPALRPQQPASISRPQITINNSGTIGSLQTGNNSAANVQQQWNSSDISELQAALAALKDALKGTQDVEPKVLHEVIADIDRVAEELQQEQPSQGKLLRWLGGVGAVVGTIGSIQPAYEAVKAMARALGLPL